MVNNISPQKAHGWLISGEAILIDVREAEEFQSEHIAYALSLPLSSIDSDFSNLAIPSSRKIIFQCLKGVRGEKACAIISDKDCCSNEIYNIEGGISAWKQESLPLISKITNSGISIFRQVQIIIGGLIALLIVIGSFGMGVAFAFAGVLGFALFFSGLTGWCGLAMLLSKMPWNNK